MKITLAKYAGFCMGVRRALSLCMDGLKKGNVPLYTLGHIIHNNTVIDELEQLGVKSINDFDKLSKDDFLLIRSHGITPQIRKNIDETGLRICDATCPKVARVQGIIRAHVKKGYFIVIIGDRGHAETQGLLGHAEQEGSGEVVSTIIEAESLVSLRDSKKAICVVAQTTQSIEVFNDLCSLMEKHFVNLKVINTICDATQHRQEEISKCAKDFDRIIVAGARHSANTTRLFEIAKKSCNKVYHVERASELDISDIKSNENIFITAGASTPLWIIHEIIEKLNEKTLKGSIFSIMDSTYIFWCLSFLMIFFSLYKSNIILLFITVACVLASRGLVSYYLKHIDVLRLDYIYGKTKLLIGIGLLLGLSFWNPLSLFVALYYGLIFYLVYNNYPLGRKFLFLLSNAIFIILAFFLV